MSSNITREFWTELSVIMRWYAYCILHGNWGKDESTPGEPELRRRLHDCFQEVGIDLAGLYHEDNKGLTLERRQLVQIDRLTGEVVDAELTWILHARTMDERQHPSYYKLSLECIREHEFGCRETNIDGQVVRSPNYIIDVTCESMSI